MVDPSLQFWLSVVMATAWVILSVTLVLFALSRIKKHADSKEGWQPSYMEMSAIWAAISALWWIIAGGFAADRMTCIISASLFGLSIGALVGFIFTSYTEESNSVGKVRDWLVAALATLSLAEAATGAVHVRQLLALFNDPAMSYPMGVTLANIVAFAVLGFWGSFILRELFLNIRFARARNERKRLELALDDVEPAIKQIAVDRRTSLSHIRDGGVATPEQRDVAARIVNLVRAAKISFEGLAKDQALIVAECYALSEHFDAAASMFVRIVERFGFDEQAVEGAAYCYECLGAFPHAAKILEQHRDKMGEHIDQWLGYYLLWVVDRLEDAASRSLRYIRHNPEIDLVAANLNLACAHAQLFARDGNPSDRLQALRIVRRMVEIQPDLKEWFRRRAVWDQDFFVLKNDPDFLQAVGPSI
ncbi:MAG: hypothetical protein JNM86_06580 [Phycisphaerae bacterium]|nr:hypothetical protein [Phycisphaerae bacterium]